MRAVRQYEFGPPSVLLIEELEAPSPGAGEVLIAVEASGVHFIDTVIRRGIQMGPMPLPALPMTPGREVAGVVAAGGDEWVGRRVVAHLGPASGGYAQRAVAPVSSLHERPSGLSADLAVAMIGTGRTAVSILRTAALTSADTVLITAAAGGLGTLFVQAALAEGAAVVAAAGGERKLARLSDAVASPPAPTSASAGAATPRLFAVDYLAPGWPDRVRHAVGDVTVVMDGVGGEVRRAAAGLIAPGGRLVHYGWSSGDRTPLDEEALAARGITSTFALGVPGDQRELEAEALAAAASGRLVPALHRFALTDAAAAHAAIEARATTGKVVLIP